MAKLAAQLTAELTVKTISAAGVANYAGVLQAIFVVLIIWLKEFLVLYHSACALIQQRP